MINPCSILKTETNDREALYQELKALCFELGIPYIESHIDILYGYPDKEEQHLDSYPKRSESFVRNAYNQMMACLGSLNLSNATPNWGTGYMNIKDTAGTIRSANQPGFGKQNTESADNWIRASSGVKTSGILVGSSSAAESFEHYNLQTQLSTDQTYDAMDAPSFSQVGLTSKVSYSRKITNATGGEITYREVGLFGIFYDGTAYPFMLSRDLITPALALNTTGWLIPTYTISLTYPS